MEMKTLESMEGATVTPTSKVSPLKNQMTLPQLQKMADKQRQQILRNNQELIQKQQRLMEMQSGMRRSTTPSQGSPKPNANDTYAAKLRETYQNHLSRLRTLNNIQSQGESQKLDNIVLAHELEKVQEIFKEKQKELTIAAAKVDNLTKQLDGRRMGLSNARATPEKLNRRRKIRAARDELDKLRKELSSRNEINNQQEAELDIQKTSLKEKRKELQELDKKINLLGHQLHPSDNDSDASTSSELLNGDVNGNSKFGSKNLFDTLQKKKFSDKVLNDFQVLPNFNRPVGIPEKSPVPYTRRGNFYVAPDGREFDRPPTVEDYPQFVTGSLTNLPSLAAPASVPVRSASSDSLPILRGSSPHLPRSRTDVNPLLQVNSSNDQLVSQQKSVGAPPASPSIHPQAVAKFGIHSPTSSISSLSSITSADADTIKQSRGFTNEGSKQYELEIWTESTDFRTSSPIRSQKMDSLVFKDASLSESFDVCSGTASKYLDSHKSDCTEMMNFQKNITSQQILVKPEEKLLGQNLEESIVKAENNEKPPPLPRKSSKPPEVPKKPAIAPKPTLPPKKSKQMGSIDNAADRSAEREVAASDQVTKNFSHAREPNVSDLAEEVSQLSIHRRNEPVTGNNDPPNFRDVNEMGKAFGDGNAVRDAGHDQFVDDGDLDGLSHSDMSTFADIDMISETQNDLLPYLTKMISEQPFEPVEQPSEDDASSQASENEKVVLPVLISVPPEKMPPTILKKPGRDNKKRGRIQLDPHALLLDAALEGEVKLVQEMVHKVPDPSFANAEGITALHNAVCGNHKDVVRLLVDIGCDINSPDNNGWTPLHCAAFYNDVELCRFLVEHGASVFAMTYSDRQTAAEKCSRLEENYDQCFGFLHECKEHVGRINNGEVCSLYEYAAEREDELSFHCGEQLRVLRRGDANEREWWWAENRKKQSGYIPYNLLGIYPRIAGEV